LFLFFISKLCLNDLINKLKLLFLQNNLKSFYHFGGLKKEKRKKIGFFAEQSIDQRPIDR
jgi:hypothetical protein